MLHLLVVGNRRLQVRDHPGRNREKYKRGDEHPESWRRQLHLTSVPVASIEEREDKTKERHTNRVSLPNGRLAPV